MEADLAPFLAASAVVDHDHTAVCRLAQEVRRPTDVETARAAFEIVRDRYPHSYDIDVTAVSVSGSDVLRHGHGICYAKSHLLAALLRACAIPAGLGYQRLYRDDTGTTCLHGFNAVWLTGLGRWHRLDARGNKPGIATTFDLAHENLAFAVRPALGECTYDAIHAEPLACVLQALRLSASVAELDRRLPADVA